MTSIRGQTWHTFMSECTFCLVQVRTPKINSWTTKGWTVTKTSPTDGFEKYTARNLAKIVSWSARWGLLIACKRSRKFYLKTSGRGLALPLKTAMNPWQNWIHKAAASNLANQYKTEPSHYPVQIMPYIRSSVSTFLLGRHFPSPVSQHFPRFL